MKNRRLLDTVAGLTRLMETPAPDEETILKSSCQLMASLVAHDDWLPDALAKPHPDYYTQYLLYGDPLERFSLVSFVWGPGQTTPIHDHTVWGVIAMLRGAELDQHYRRTSEGIVQAGGESRLHQGEVACVSPRIGDIHRVSNAYDDRVSISIHLYGGNIGRIRRSVYNPATGEPKEFVSGYSNDMTPNLWAPAA
ncbi:cysteine dioxygenase [Pollutimonas subterranea]|uniref:Cysteine dioxygenase n=1 Tax=Pollutimonas subterranea TaxID=2045210 RepID=A0A2N4U6H6_9BURK|nr:cysteine dioxygenase [Pollutimonas subterranea]PLC50597.1 cysteine dioxygenase [Pollutimonas subterranea]